MRRKILVLQSTCIQQVVIHVFLWINRAFLMQTLFFQDNERHRKRSLYALDVCPFQKRIGSGFSYSRLGRSLRASWIVPGREETAFSLQKCAYYNVGQGGAWGCCIPRWKYGSTTVQWKVERGEAEMRCVDAPFDIKGNGGGGGGGGHHLLFLSLAPSDKLGRRRRSEVEEEGSGRLVWHQLQSNGDQETGGPSLAWHASSIIVWY